MIKLDELLKVFQEHFTVTGYKVRLQSKIDKKLNGKLNLVEAL